MDCNLTNTPTCKSSDKKEVKLLILGSGPAGLSAAIYAARADLKPVVLTGMELGGQVSLTNVVENYPGFPEGIGGFELVERFKKQAEHFGAMIEFDSAVEVDLAKYPFFARTYQAEYLAEAVIVATGASAVRLDVPGEKEFTGRGVSYCATCDGCFFKEKDLVVVGGGDSALEEAIFLTRYAKSVSIVHRRDELRAGTILKNRATANPKIRFIMNTIVTSIFGEDAVKSVKLKNVVTGEITEYPTDGVFIFIGRSPNTQLFAGQLEMDDRKYIQVDQFMRSKVKGVFVAGEAADPHFRQVITSAGMGAAAAMQAIHFLQDRVEISK